MHTYHYHIYTRLGLHSLGGGEATFLSPKPKKKLPFGQTGQLISKSEMKWTIFHSDRARTKRQQQQQNEQHKNLSGHIKSCTTKL